MEDVEEEGDSVIPVQDDGLIGGVDADDCTPYSLSESHRMSLKTIASFSCGSPHKLKHSHLEEMVQAVIRDASSSGKDIAVDTVLGDVQEVFEIDLSSRRAEIESALRKASKALQRTPKVPRSNASREKKACSVNSASLVITRSAIRKPMMLCQLDDEALDFEGDSGAIGRFVISNDTCKFTDTEAKVQAMSNDVAVLSFEKSVVDGPSYSVTEDDENDGLAKHAVDATPPKAEASRKRGREVKISTIRQRRTSSGLSKKRKKHGLNKKK